MPAAKPSKPKTRVQAQPPVARLVAVAAKPAPPAAKRFLVRCTFLGEDKKQKLEGSFRFVCEAADANAVRPKLAPAVKKLRRTGELPSRCAVYVEFILELTELSRGVVADFERWEREPRRFQHGCVAFSETSPVYDQGSAEPAFRFGPEGGAA